ncbi:MAG: NADH-quinone oxidoreductase subunit F [Candidatus Omnitrophica bacterium CG11_big_fil_rev_8_21_14_0_20_63_9]|nr:MAG: NADH-quinone oxidoreductase subunit F [Candidatus Omnitrophica bacterium CG11_big_fil_rev_8_21_14_0_20_63_9]
MSFLDLFRNLDQLFVNVSGWLLGLLPDWLQPWASIAMRIGVIAAIAPAIMMYLTWIERKAIARMQNRYGPTRVGIYGLAQPLADGLKMLNKEDIVPRGADRLVHLIAPVLAVAPAILLFAVMPFGRNLIAADLNVGLLYVFAISSISSYAIFMGGWASRSKFSVLGAMRGVAQIVSYEVPSVLSAVAVIMVTGSLSLGTIVESQAGYWFVFTPWGFVACLIFFLSGVAEVNRTPFDMPEAESELVGGFHTEYSGMKFALWYMAEFLESFAVCAFTVALFLGGWHGPAIPFWVLALALAILIGTARLLPLPVRGVGALVMVGAGVFWAAQPIPSWIWFLSKTYFLFFVLVWFRGTFPRLRADQLMGLAWKFFLPLALVNILVAGVWLMPQTPVRWAPCLLILWGAVSLLVAVNKPSITDRRTYVLAD